MKPLAQFKEALSQHAAWDVWHAALFGTAAGIGGLGGTLWGAWIAR